MSWLRGLVLGSAVAAVVAGSGLVGGSSAEDRHRGRWQEVKLSTYSFVLTAGCGERALIGRFAVTVSGSDVTLVEGLDAQGRAVQATFDERDGHLTHPQIDDNENATDDEACYLVTNYSR